MENVELGNIKVALFQCKRKLGSPFEEITIWDLLLYSSELFHILKTSSSFGFFKLII